MKSINKLSAKDRGFSLVEIIVVVAILAVLAGVLAPQYLKHLDTAKRESTLTNCCNVVKAAKILETDKAIEFEPPYTKVKNLSKVNGTINEIRESENGIIYIKYTEKYVAIYENGEYRIEE